MDVDRLAPSAPVIGANSVYTQSLISAVAPSPGAVTTLFRPVEKSVKPEARVTLD